MEHVHRNGGRATPHRVVGGGGIAPPVFPGLPVLGQGGGDFGPLGAAGSGGVGQQAHFAAFLRGKGHPRFDRRIKARFQVEIDRTVEQRTGGREHEAVRAEMPCGQVQAGQSGDRVHPPDVAAIDQAKGKGGLRGQRLGHRRDLARVPHAVDMERVHGKAFDKGQIMRDAAKVGGQQQLGRTACPDKMPVGVLELPAQGWRQVLGQDRLVKFDPGAKPAQAAEDFAVSLDQGGEQRPTVETGHVAFPEGQEGERTGEHGLGGIALTGGFLGFVEDFRGRQGKGLAGHEFRDDVMIVGVEPLGHFHGGNVPVAVLDAPGHGEIGRRVHLAALMPVAFREDAKEAGHVEHVVVEGEVADRDEVQAGIVLEFPVALAQGCGGLGQGVCVKFAGPVLFQGGLEFPVASHAGETQ